MHDLLNKLYLIFENYSDALDYASQLIKETAIKVEHKILLKNKITKDSKKPIAFASA